MEGAFLTLSFSSVDVSIDVSDAKGVKDILIKQDVTEEPFGDEGCRLFGSVTFKKVAGDLMFAHEGSLTIFSFQEFLNFNASHVVNHLRFGPQIPNMETPLIDVSKIITTNGASQLPLILDLFGRTRTYSKNDVVIPVATYKYFVNIVPTKYVYLNGASVTTFQYSVTEHETKVRG